MQARPGAGGIRRGGRSINGRLWSAAGTPAVPLWGPLSLPHRHALASETDQGIGRRRSTRKGFEQQQDFGGIVVVEVGVGGERRVARAGQNGPKCRSERLQVRGQIRLPEHCG